MADKTLHSIKFPNLTDTYKIPDIVNEYSTSSAYAVGDYVTKDGKTYKCITAIASGETWTSAHWSEVKIGNDLKGQVTDLKSAINNCTKVPVIAKTISGTKRVRLNKYVPSGDYVFECDQIVTQGTDSTVSCVGIYDENGQSIVTLTFERNTPIKYAFNLASDAYTFDFYAENLASTSTGDTFSYDNVVLYQALTDATLTLEYKPAEAKAVGDRLTSLQNDCYTFRTVLNGANPATTIDKIGTYTSRKIDENSNYPDDMVLNHWCVIICFQKTTGGIYYNLIDANSGEQWFYFNGYYIKYANNDDVLSLENNAFLYRGSLNASNPTTANVKVGTYASQKLSENNGYPSDMQINHYCLITYFVKSNSGTYFNIYDVSTGEIWNYSNGLYTKCITYNDFLIKSNNTLVNYPLSGNFNGIGSNISFEYEECKTINPATGAITSLSDSENNRKWRISNKISSADIENIKISLYMRYNNGVIVFYQDDNILSVINSSSIGEIIAANQFLVTDYCITIPPEANYFRIGYHTDHPCKLIKITDFWIKNRTLSGKKWACIGDSLTDPATTRASKKYYDYIINNTGVNFVNLGVSGTGYANDHNGAGRFIERVSLIPEDTDLVTIFGSGNDMNVLPIGTADDTTSETVMGYVYLTIQSIITNRPKILIGIISPTPWVQYPPYTENNMKTFSEELKKFCEKYSIPFLNLYLESNLRPWEESFRNNFYTKDNGNGVHPDENGNKRFAGIMQSFIEKLILSDND